MIDLTDFLLARYAEDEEVARAAHVTTALPPIWDTGLFYGPSAPASAHIARHDPARVLAECAAKRRIVESEIRREVGPVSHYVSSEVHAQIAARTATPVLRLLALPYADHPDYREEWRL